MGTSEVHEKGKKFSLCNSSVFIILKFEITNAFIIKYPSWPTCSNFRWAMGAAAA